MADVTVLTETFSSGTTATDANFTNINSTASISGGVLTSTNDYKGCHNTDIGNADMWVECDFIVGSSYTGDSGITVRQASAADTKYRFHATGGTWRLGKSVTGTDTNLQTGSSGPSNNTTYRLRLTVVGSTITGYVDGVQVVQATDSAITSNTKVGIGIYTAGTGTAAVSFDNYTAGYFGADSQPFLFTITKTLT